MNIVLLGAPGAGKGTQAVVLSQQYNLKLVGTGDLLRKEISGGSAPGLKASVFVEAGQLVPDELVFDIIQDNLTDTDWERGLLFDGFPRTLNQAEKLDKMFTSQRKNIDRVLFISADNAILVDRLVNRRICQSCLRVFGRETQSNGSSGKCKICGGVLTKRPDDNPETVKKRLQEYKEKTEPILRYYGGKVLRVDGSLTIQDVTKQLIAAVESSSIHQ